MASQQYTFFGEHRALEALSQKGDRLEELNAMVQLGPLVAVADKIWRANAGSKSAAGRKPMSSEVMLRVLLLKRFYNLSDEQTEYQLRDRLSFMRFAGLGLGDAVPDARTIWLYGEALSRADAARQLFETFNEQLAGKGLMVKEGVLVDATIVEVPRQRNSREENRQIKEGQTPEAWKEDPKKLAHKDLDARWTKKNGQNYYGYKDHVKVGRKTKLIEAYTVTPASTHDSVELPKLVKAGDQSVHADSAYAGEPCAKHLRESQAASHVNEKGVRGRQLSEEQKQNNKEKRESARAR